MDGSMQGTSFVVTGETLQCALPGAWVVIDEPAAFLQQEVDA